MKSFGTRIQRILGSELKLRIKQRSDKRHHGAGYIARRCKRSFQDQRRARTPRCQINRNRVPSDCAMHDNLLGPIAFAQQIDEARFAVAIQALFARPSATLAIAAIIQDEHRRSSSDDLLDVWRAIA